MHCPMCGATENQHVIQEFTSAFRIECRKCGITYGVKREVSYGAGDCEEASSKG